MTNNLFRTNPRRPFGAAFFAATIEIREWPQARLTLAARNFDKLVTQVKDD